MALDRRGSARRLWMSLFVGVVAGVVTLSLGVPAASAADFVHRDGSFAGAGSAPTADKPQSKLWFNDGIWWANMFHPASGTWHIFRLNRATHTWSDTGTRIDDRARTRGDVLWDGKHLYAATHALAASSTQSVSGKPARLYRYTYNSARRSYRLDPGFPVAINNVSSESLTLDKDSKGVLWATWTQGRKVYLNSTKGTDTSWGKPFALNVPGAAGLKADDVSSVAAYGGSKIGLMWSNQATSSFYFAVHRDGDTRTRWTARKALSDPQIADDHINLKQFAGDPSGRLFAAVKTSLEGKGPKAPQILLLSFDPTRGTWSSTTYATAADCLSRPVVMIDSTNKVLHVFATGPSGGGCPRTGTPGTIYEKTTPMSKIAFGPGRGRAVITDTKTTDINNVTGTKQSLTSATGLVMLASSDATQRYWHADIPLPRRVQATRVDFKASKATARTMRFTGTSTGPIAKWSWKFGDGQTSTAKSPAHTYKKAGTYRVTLRGVEPSGRPVEATHTIKVT